MESFKKLVVDQIKGIRPSFISRQPHFNFISAHYFWIIGLALLGSVIVFAAGRPDLAYIDALFHAVGACTQGGLTTVDLNTLNTFQQVVFYLWAMLTNPITINSFVVFLRLYWFEKRFQHIVRESRKKRGAISKSKTQANLDAPDVERAVNGPRITGVLHGARSPLRNDGTSLERGPPPAGQGGSSPRRDSAHQAGGDGPLESSETRHTATNSGGLGKQSLTLPSPRFNQQEHVAFLERQRKGDGEVLRIPNPRDVERGVLPKRVEPGDEEQAEAEAPSPRRPESAAVASESQMPAAVGRQQAITIEEPDRRKLQQSESDHGRLVADARAAARAFSFLKLRKPRFLSRTSRRLHGKEGEELVIGAPKPKAGRQSPHTLRTVLSRDRVDGTPYLSWEPTIGRNSAFLDLTEAQREELGGVEYRSLKMLALVLTGYFWIFSAIGIIGLLPWILHVNTYGQVVDAAGVSRTWWAFFTANSAFLDLGFTLTPDSMNSFQAAVWPMLLFSFLIVIGNTGFPVMLRFIIWLASHLVPVDTGIYEELRFLLDHPRRCFTLLFPSSATWWLFWLLVVLLGLDVVLFIVLDLGAAPVVNLPAGLKVLNGLFEAVSTRTAGFSSVNLAQLHPAVQVSYMVMMYISVFPIAISVRRTNVYEEKSLGVYNEHDADELAGQSDMSHVGAHLRRQLSFDLWYIAIGFFVLNITEGNRLTSNDFTQFAVLFEAVSAYGTVGMSLGYPTVNASLSSQFSVVGKLVIIAMMIRGRHRGLPYGLDRAILLPNESLHATDAADADARAALSRRLSQTPAAASATAGAAPPRPASLRRRTSLAADHGNILTSLLHPGPPRPADSPVEEGIIRRRATDPEWGDAEPYATRVSSRHTEPGAAPQRAHHPALLSARSRPPWDSSTRPAHSSHS